MSADRGYFNLYVPGIAFALRGMSLPNLDCLIWEDPVFLDPPFFPLPGRILHPAPEAFQGLDPRGF